jgi:hypothetical protein
MSAAGDWLVGVRSPRSRLWGAWRRTVTQLSTRRATYLPASEAWWLTTALSLERNLAGGWW